MNKKRLGVFIFLTVILLGAVSAETCSIQTSCNAANTVMKLSGTTNAHGEEWNQGSYNYYLCCDFTGTHTCDGLNKILGLSSSTNAHAEIPSLTNYGTHVCFRDLECVSGASCPAEYDIPIDLSLSSNTNAHLGSFGTYSTKICCKHPDCAFTSASWSTNNTVEGQSVSLNVAGTNCDGETLSFVVWEEDLIGDDSVIINPTNVIFSGNSATGTWTAEWQDDGIGDPEYYFIATIISTGDYIKSSYPLLTVTRTGEPILNCTDIFLCMDYTIQETCESDVCEVAAGATMLGVDCNDPEINCECSWDGSVCAFSWGVGVCGDGIINRGETCDSDNWGPITGCSNFDEFTGGSLSCVNCNFDTSQCTGGHGPGICGDSVINTGETCDGNPPGDYDWGPITGCSNFDAFTGGSLSCVNCNFDTSQCTGSDADNYPSSIGTCFYHEGTNDNCDDGFLTYSWISNWIWDLSNIFFSNPDGDDFLLGEDGKWHYDPERKFENCVDGSNTVPCPAQIKLPFFSSYSFIISLILIALIYYFIDFNKRKR